MVLSAEQLGALRADLPDATLVLRVGCYDLLHSGHVEGIDFAARQGDVLVVGVLPDAMVKRQKGPDRPVNPETERASAIDRLAGVGYTFVLPQSTRSLIGVFQALRPDVYVEHVEHKGSSLLRAIFVRAMGIKLVVDTGEKTQSTTAMIRHLGRLAAQEQAASYLNSIARN